ncbi:MAG: 2-oxoacid:acceptor oxidoreductase subunit alpha [Thermoplasmatota archaeon]
MRYPKEGNKDVSLVICGEAGQGIKTVEELLVKVLKRSGYHVHSIKEYESRVRGGSNSTSIRVSSVRVRAPVKRVDIAFPMTPDAVWHIRWRMDENTTVICDPDLAGELEGNGDFNVLRTEIKKRAEEIGGSIYINIVVAGMIAGYFDVEEDLFDEVLEERFSGKGEKALEKNLKARKAGYGIAEEMKKEGELDVDLEEDDGVKDEILMRGVNSISLGALAGGCDTISSYPMSPSTGVLVDLASRQKKYGVIAEQAEDEISAMNMALGSWYAGGRAMVTTSGGGFALMSEGMSLAGMLELPMVVHLAQRPGPATGLPTRTEQGDLFLALFSGHGDLPRAIYAPADIEQGFDLTRRAFETADRFQVPVVVLTDQFLVDSHYNVKELDLSFEDPKRHIEKTESGYKRYRITENGVSPRGVPGHGGGLVKMDSDEHDEEGHITESMEVRVKMVDKRMRKLDLLKDDVLPPMLIGDGEGIVVLCWGSTLHTVKEAVACLDRDDISILHLRQVHPLSQSIRDIIEGSRMTIGVENNATGQLSSLIRMELGLEVEHRILKYDGLPFTVEELADEVEKVLEKGGEWK